MLGARCEHYELGTGTFPVPGHYQPARVPVEHCNLCETVVGGLDDYLPPLVYGPDGRLVMREACTRRRFEDSCRPAMARQRANRPRRAAGRAQEAGVPARSRSQQLRTQSGSVRSRARSVLERAERLRQRAQATLERSMAVQARHRGLNLGLAAAGA